MKTLISAEEIRKRVLELAARINQDYANDSVTLIGILSGSLIFLADLVRELKLPTRIGFLRASSYRGETTTSGQLEILHEGLLPDVRGRHIILVDDILDSGHTMAAVAGHMRQLAPKSVRTAVLLRKLGRQIVPFEPDYTGFEIPNFFVVGYGLDYNDDYRHLPYLAVLDQGA
jgi:hypoxanthine phosphoribosyltransferase